MKLFFTKMIVILAGLAYSGAAMAQCAMCKANAENASRDDAAIGQELNSGILYLMGVPYLLLALGVLVFYRKKILTFMRS